ncbi:phytoene synthase [Amycolatopsis regifaucium]|nr:phytoene synthase [Amycolatopsis regifaucium]
MYRRAEAGIPLLREESRACVRTALVLCEGILDEIVALDYDVLNTRVVVPRRRRTGVALPGLLTSAWSNSRLRVRS